MLAAVEVYVWSVRKAVPQYQAIVVLFPPKRQHTKKNSKTQFVRKLKVSALHDGEVALRRPGTPHPLPTNLSVVTQDHEHRCSNFVYC